LSADSAEKSRAVWCSKDKAKAWADMMLQGKNVPAGSCEASALARNIDFAKKNRITGTPTIIFADGTRVPGAINAQQVEKYLAETKAL
ncbi:MAG: thioredoxin fold domain-containing protein, partial [Polaromonas sp.]|nr:thioredoxin fold domain-containing protein [Polaromonas sp.]